MLTLSLDDLLWKLVWKGKADVERPVAELIDLDEAAFEVRCLARALKRANVHQLGSNEHAVLKQAARCEVGNALAWCAAEISGLYNRLELSIHIRTPRNWATFAVPAEFVEAAGRLRPRFM